MEQIKARPKKSKFQELPLYLPTLSSLIRKCQYDFGSHTNIQLQDLPISIENHSQLLASSYDFEILVYDDASTTLHQENKNIASLPDTNYKILSKNIGRTAIRNLLANEAKYNWLLFLDADVLPKNETFIQYYLDALGSKEADVVFGGITYQKGEPEKEKSLRWHYGKKREAKTIKAREQNPYFIISQNLLIQKTVFLEANTITENYYGLDNYFSNQLKRQGRKVIHIDNPIIHYGLEDNAAFVKKALKAVETTVMFEAKGLMDAGERPIQRAYQKLKKLHLIRLFSVVIGWFTSSMESNFSSGKPNLFWFDLYRLKHYIDLKKLHNA